MTCCFAYIYYYYFKNNKIIQNSEYSEDKISKNTNITENTSLNNDKDKYLIIDNNIYTECTICLQINALESIKMFYPCGHRLYCDVCIKNMDKCPCCRHSILKKVKIYENLDYSFNSD
tara:strand:- start:3771 stop:4124 length:354 start_codon:yes stop_codon:yes gene_type:complete